MQKILTRLSAALACLVPLAACSGADLVNALTPEEGYRLEQGLAYGPDPRHRLDLYLPEDKAPQALVVFFYGGSWEDGARGDYRFVGEAFATRGIALAVADYRLYPQVVYPAFLEDSAAAVAWLRARHEEPLFLLGHSAGAYNAVMLALASGNKRFKDSNHLNQVLEAPDREELIHWLRHRPLMHRDGKLEFTMVHAGLPPQWDLTTARNCASEVEAVLRGSDYRVFFDQMYGNKPNRWDAALEGMDRLRFITNCFTRLRFVTRKGKLKLKLKGSPLGQKKKYIPWFAHPHRLTRNDRILFGHWSTLGYQVRHNTWALDTGCLWGGALTALRIDQDPPSPVQHQCQGQQDPAMFV